MPDFPCLQNASLPSIMTAGLLSVLTPQSLWASEYQTCLLEALHDASPDTTVAQLQARCRPPQTVDALPDLDAPSAGSDITSAASDENTDSLLEQRVQQEERTQNKLFVLTPHRQNYFLPISYNSNPNSKPFDASEDDFDSTEVKFQLSLKVPVAQGVFNGHGDLYFAYTGVSWWQAYNKDHSSPFRDTNHEPEAFFSFNTDYDVLGLKLSMIQAGINHQSNGRSGSLSRSWNRLFANFVFEHDNFYFSVNPWWRIPESSKDSPDDPRGDDNPDIEKYLGYGDVQMFYTLGVHKLSVMVRNNLRSDNKGAMELGWSFPLTPRIRGYVQYFNGYGESLIDYNASVNRLSIGVMLNDWL
ncbi:phospholipase A [Kistimonas asteriae]|uniref:phospholipase A n=1 Tax=Kistimonas asteriae TaxID=517724 RepID=UPI001FEAAC05|nr:phospholipase A [Kistimonas asteriae]